MNDENTVNAVVGQVKWFDTARGFGFVVADNGGADILLHANVLRAFGQSTIADAARIEMTIQETDRGIQAVEVLSIEPPVSSTGPDLEDLEHLDEVDLSVPLVPARVKWFDKGKGFGFANIFGRDEDVFLHVEVLRQSGLSDVQSGEALAMRVIDGKRGHMAVEVRAWEAAMGDPEHSI